MTKVKKTKVTALDRIAARVRTALRSQTKNVIEIGKLLIESREHLEHGEWQAWLAENFDLSLRTAQNYCSAAEYVTRVRGKSATVADFTNLSPTVHFDEREEAAILAATRERRVDEDAAWAICEALVPPDDTADDDQDDDQDGDGGDDTEPAAAEGEKIAAIFDNPPTPPAGSSENLAPTDHGLARFDFAVGALTSLMTKRAAQFAGSVHSARDLEAVESFLHAVAEAKVKTKAVAANGGTEPPR